MAATLAEPAKVTEVESDVSKILGENLSILGENEVELAHMLVSAHQGHLFAGWPDCGVDDASKHRFFDQVRKLDDSYPGGLAAYISNGRRLLADSKEGKNPFEGYTPSVPSGERLVFGDAAFDEFEEEGVREARNAAFVLVAGGLGERLGYSGIKVALPAETTTGKCFLQLYVESILALEEASNEMRAEGEEYFRIPFAIMTSDDTHARTQELLEGNDFFGMQQSQIWLLKQEKVACLADNDARIALDPSDKFSIQTKPHGHGDVHSLLFSSGLLAKWKDQGRKWVLFFQDTNALLFKAIPASLGVSSKRAYDVNSLAVPRKAKEAIGGIARLTHVDGRQMVINVEYNQLDPLLRATGHPEGDVNDETGYSPFPGNINQLVVRLESYLEELSRTKGAISEFVNPKYKDETKTAFKSSTRLECMMQDYPKTLAPTAHIGFTVLDVWLAYSPVKNNVADAIAKVKGGTPPHSATSGELAIYRAHSLILKQAGVQVGRPERAEFNSQEGELWPRIVWSPRWGVTFARVRSKISRPDSCRISEGSMLVIDGREIFLEELDLDGALVLRAGRDVHVHVKGLQVKNEGWKLDALAEGDEAPEEIRIRGFRVVKQDTENIAFLEPGEYQVPT